MANTIGTISVRVDNAALDEIDRMAAYFEVAPDDDAAKVAMADFGEIDADTHIIVESGMDDGGYFVRTKLSSELQAICDMVP